jgi:hypothetical protein
LIEINYNYGGSEMGIFANTRLTLGMKCSNFYRKQMQWKEDIISGVVKFKHLSAVEFDNMLHILTGPIPVIIVKTGWHKKWNNMFEWYIELDKTVFTPEEQLFLANKDAIIMVIHYDKGLPKHNYIGTEEYLNPLFIHCEGGILKDIDSNKRYTSYPLAVSNLISNTNKRTLKYVPGKSTKTLGIHKKHKHNKKVSFVGHQTNHIIQSLRDIQERATLDVFEKNNEYILSESDKKYLERVYKAVEYLKTKIST